jgi:transposase, IS5 family
MSLCKQNIDVSQPFKEVCTMIAHTFQDAFSAQWIKTNLTNPTHDLILLRRLIPWQAIIHRLTPFYHANKGRNGQSLRTTIAVSLVARLRQLSDRRVIEEIKENRYMQYFCNVPDQGLQTFMDPSTLCRFRKRLGTQGVAIIEEGVFDHLKDAHAIEADMMLQDSTVLESPIIYPTDVRLLYKAFDKMAIIAKQAQSKPWWDEAEIKKLWRAHHLDGTQPLAYLCAFYLLFEPALETFATHQRDLPEGALKTQAHELLEALLILDEQTQLKLEGDIHIPHRLVSLDDLDARPIQKGKRHPKTEFGTMLQLSFNRQGFLITAENFIGKPDDRRLYGPTLELFRTRMSVYPGGAVTDLGYRNPKNLKLHHEDLDFVFMGNSADVDEAHKQEALKARSATEGFIAVAKTWRGFGRSLYRGLQGATLWTLLNQCAYNLKKVLQLYRNESLSEATLMALRL